MGQHYPVYRSIKIWPSISDLAYQSGILKIPGLSLGQRGGLHGAEKDGQCEGSYIGRFGGELKI